MTCGEQGDHHGSSALFRRAGPNRFAPTESATGAWDASIIHGAALAALLAGRMRPHGSRADDWTLARLTIELVAPAPLAPVELSITKPVGGRRAQRQAVEVMGDDGRVVATAASVLVRRAELELPDAARRTESPFAPDGVPPLDTPNRRAAKTVGFENFDSMAAIVEWMKVPGDRRAHQWITLAVPVVEGEPLLGVEVAAVAADYAQTAVHIVLPFGDWRFINTELTLHLTRDPIGPWVGLRSDHLLSPVGTGFNSGELFDSSGPLGRTTAALVVESR